MAVQKVQQGLHAEKNEMDVKEGLKREVNEGA